MVVWTAAVATLLTGCGRPAKSRDGTTVTASGAVPFPVDFVPSPALPPPAGADAKAFGASYLEMVYPRIRDGWHQFLEDCRLRLPPAHPLNSPTLAATVGITVDRQGQIVDVAMLTGSGDREFDDAAMGVATDAGPFPAPARPLLSDDDQVYLTWLFARDQRQAGPATASLRRVEWSLDQAVPKFIATGDLDEAARRLAAASPTVEGAARDSLLGLAERVATATVREGLASPEQPVQRLAIEIAAAARLTPAARELRSIADGSLAIGLRAAAIDALAVIGDREAIGLIRGILARDQGANAELTGAAARALGRLGATAELNTLVAGWLAEGRAGTTAAHRAKSWAALVAAAHAPATAAVPDANRLVGTGDPALRGAACRALGHATAADASAWKGLRAGLADADASVRAACAGAIADAATAGQRNRASFWAIGPLVRDRDERVRAAVVRAMARLEPARAKTELAAVGRDKSPAVLASLAEAWVVIGLPDKTVALLGHEAPAVRLAAATALAAGDAAAQQKLATRANLDPVLRVRAISVTTDRGALEAGSTDPDADVRAAAATRLIVVRGRSETLGAVMTAIAAAPPASAERVRLAGAWLAAR